MAFILFGVTGDLALRKLLPALFALKSDGALRGPIIGVSYDAEASFLLQRLHKAFSGMPEFTEDRWSAFVRDFYCVTGDMRDERLYVELQKRLVPWAEQAHTHYLSVSPSLFTAALWGLAERRLVKLTDRIIIEKPFGHDLVSAQQLNTVIHHTVGESQILRMDHYLGKEVLRQILQFRFGQATGNLEQYWNCDAIERITVTAAEELLVTGRGEFYDKVGIVRDFVQNHILQMLALVTMNQPHTTDGEGIRNAKALALKQLRVSDPEHDVVLGQYQGYRNTQGVSRDSRTPTYAALRLESADPRWMGVPITVQAGKALAKQETEMALHFRRGVLPQGRRHLRFRVQPEAGLWEDETPRLMLPGQPRCTAYDTLLAEATSGDSTHFVCGEQIEASWRIVDPVNTAWSHRAPVEYTVGSMGPVCHFEG